MEFLEKISGHFKKNDEVVCTFTCQKDPGDSWFWHIKIQPTPTTEGWEKQLKHSLNYLSTNPYPIFVSDDQVTIAIPRKGEYGVPIKKVAHVFGQICTHWEGVPLKDIEITEAQPADLASLERAPDFASRATTVMRSIAYSFVCRDIIVPIVQAAQRLAHLYKQKDLHGEGKYLPSSHVDQRTRRVVQYLNAQLALDFPEFHQYVCEQDWYQRYHKLLGELEQSHYNETISSYLLEKLPGVLRAYVTAFGQWSGLDMSVYELLCIDHYEYFPGREAPLKNIRPRQFTNY